MPDCNAELFEFPSFDRRKIEASFSGGEVSSDGGVMVLRQADRGLGLVRAFDAVIADPRHPELITHAQLDLLRQRIYGLALGYEEKSQCRTSRCRSQFRRSRRRVYRSLVCRRERRRCAR